VFRKAGAVLSQTLLKSYIKIFLKFNKIFLISKCFCSFNISSVPEEKIDLNVL